MTRLGDPERIKASCIATFNMLYLTHGVEVSWVKHPLSTLTDRFLSKLPYGAFIYDFGCGSGEKVLDIAMRRPDIRATGFDASSEAIRLAIRHAEELNISGQVKFQCRDISDLDPKRLEPADGIHEYQCLTHIVKDLHPFVTNLMSSLLKERGIAIVNAFHKDTANFYGDNISERENGEYIFKYDGDNCHHTGRQDNDGMYCYFFQKEELEDLFSPFFSNLELMPVPHPSIKGRLHWEGLFIKK